MCQSAELYSVRSFNSYHASDDKMLITFVNSLDPDQDRQYVGPDLDPNCLTLWLCSWKIFLKFRFEKSQQIDGNKSMKNYPACKENNLYESTGSKTPGFKPMTQPLQSIQERLPVIFWELTEWSRLVYIFACWVIFNAFVIICRLLSNHLFQQKIFQVCELSKYQTVRIQIRTDALWVLRGQAGPEF